MIGQPRQRRAGPGGGPQVSPPDVMPVNESGHDRLAGNRPGGREPGEVARPGDQVEPDRLDRGGQQRRQGITEIAEVCGHKQPRPPAQPTQPRVRGAKSVDLLRPPVGDIGWLVELDPDDAGLGQRGHDVGVHHHQVSQPVERPEPGRSVRSGLGQ